MLGFRLRHSYSFPRVWTDEDPDPLDKLPGWIKGSDAALYEACDTLGLKPLLRLTSHMDGSSESGRDEIKTVLLSRSVQFDDMQIENPEMEEELMKHGSIITDAADDQDSDEDEDGGTSDQVTWVTGGAKDDVDKYGTPVRQPNQFSSQYVAYGNEASLDNFYMTACMTVPIAPASDRKPTQVGAKGGNGFQDGGGETAGAGRIVTLRVVEKA